jgi:hypothetical protein
MTLPAADQSLESGESYCFGAVPGVTSGIGALDLGLSAGGGASVDGVPGCGVSLFGTTSGIGAFDFGTGAGDV